MQPGRPADGATASTPTHHSLSIAREFSGRSVLLTGATGYVGRLVLEQLLRCCPDIAAVYVLVRLSKQQQQQQQQAPADPTSSKTSSKSSQQKHSTASSSNGVTETAAATSGTTPAPAGSGRSKSSSSTTICAGAARSRLLHLVTSSGLFNAVPSAQLAKVHVVEGDMSKAGLGLAAGQVAELARHVDVVIHAAGHVDLGAGAQDVLRLNYVATEQLLQLATGQLPRLAAFTHISSVWAYADEPLGSTVKEVVKGLTMPSGQAMQPGDLVKQLMDMEAWEADAEAHDLVKHWGFPDMYCLSKRLAELLVQRYSQRYSRQYGFALVRPSIIGAVAGQPYPGYCLGNQNGATGLLAAFQSGLFTPGSLAWSGASVLDLVPGDMVAGHVMLATAEQLQRHHAAVAGIGTGPAAAAAEDVSKGSAAGADSAPAGPAPEAAAAAPLSPVPSSGTFEQQAEPHSASDGNDTEYLLVEQKGGSRGRGQAGQALSTPGSADPGSTHEPRPAQSAEQSHPPAAAATPSSPEITPAAQQPAAPNATTPSPTTAATSPTSSPALLVTQAATSSSHPLKVWQLVQAMHGFTTANPSRLRLALAGHPWLGPSYRPSRPRVWLEKALTAVKVYLTFLFLLVIGQSRLAAKLRSGFRDWQQLNRPCYDYNLRFECSRADELVGRLVPEERQGMVLTWRAGQSDWLRYMMTMAAGAQSLALKQRRPIVGVQHDFELLAPVHRVETVVLGSDC